MFGPRPIANKISVVLGASEIRCSGVPAIVTVVVLQFIQIWDDLLIGLLFLQNPDQRTITVGLGALSAGRVTDIPVLMAGSLVSAIPAVVVYLIFQRHLISGLTAGIGK